jgi:hypothetical protein
MFTANGSCETEAQSTQSGKTIEGLFKIWCLAPDQVDHIRPIETALDREAEFVYDPICDPVQLVQAKPDIAVCVNEFPLAIADCLNAARQHRIPSLLLQDGILEWRCQYENPLFGAGGGPPQHQPVLADKIACIGEQSGRLISSWGNACKVEVTGMPRLDHLLGRRKVPRNNPGRRVLIATAKNHGFTPEQREITKQSLRDIAAELRKRPDIEVMWRVPPRLATELGVDNRLLQFSSQDFAATVEQADAFITTPSTSMLEAMLLERPVAALDYHNVPRFVSTAWTISAREHIASVLDDILRCPHNKMHYQHFLLYDSIHCEGPSAPRVADLIRKMVKSVKAAGPGVVQLPGGMLPRNSFELIREFPALADLYPDQELFRTTDLAMLQAETTRLRKANERLKSQLDERSLSNAITKCARYFWQTCKRTG